MKLYLQCTVLRLKGELFTNHNAHVPAAFETTPMAVTATKHNACCLMLHDDQSQPSSDFAAW